MTLMYGIITGIIALFSLVVLRGAPYVPSRRKDVAPAFDELYPLSANDTLVDIGSGDGIVLRQAAARGARAIGFEINPILVILSRLLSLHQPGVQTKWRDFWLTPLPVETTVVYVFGESRDIVKMAARVQSEANRLHTTIWLISYAFAVPGLRPTRSFRAHFLYEMNPLQSAQPKV